MEEYVYVLREDMYNEWSWEKRLANNNDSGVYIDIYENEEDYSNGTNMATLIVSYEKIEK